MADSNNNYGSNRDGGLSDSKTKKGQIITKETKYQNLIKMMKLPIKNEQGIDWRRTKTDAVYFMEKTLGGFKPRKDQMPVVKYIENGAKRQGRKRLCLAKGRRWGGSKIISACVLWLCSIQSRSLWGIYAPGWDEVAVFKDHIKEHYEGKLFEGAIKKDQKEVLELTNGSRILFRVLSKTSQGKRGRGFDGIVFTEAAFISGSELHAVRPSGLDRPNGFEIHESSPNGRNHFFKTFSSKYFKSWQFPTILNPLVQKEEIEIEREHMTKAQAAQEFDADFLDDSQCPFPEILLDEAIKNNITWMTRREKTGMYIAGLDLGRRRDRSVLVIGKVEGKRIRIVVIKEFLFNPDDPRFWHKVVKGTIFFLKEFGISTIHVDRTGVGDAPCLDLQNEINKKNIQCRLIGYDFGTNSYKIEGLINMLVLRFERYQIYFPFHMEFVKQLRSVNFDAQKNRYFTEGKSPDMVMACALMVKGAPTYDADFYSKTISQEKTQKIEHVRTNGIKRSYAGLV
jgi:hypothetical protein